MLRKQLNLSPASAIEATTNGGGNFPFLGSAESLPQVLHHPQNIQQLQLLSSDSNVVDRSQGSNAIISSIQELKQQPEKGNVASAEDTIGVVSKVDHSQKQQQSQQLLPKKGEKEGIFSEYQRRWQENNTKLFRYLITWRVGVDGKIEDQLKLMITYLTAIFVFILVVCGLGITLYFHTTNKQNIKNSIESQATTILTNSLDQYKNSTEYIFKGYEFVLNYLSEIVLSKLKISQRIYDYNFLQDFPFKGPSKMRQCNVLNPDCTIYSGDYFFSSGSVSLKCLDWCEFDTSTVPLVASDVYQTNIDQATLNSAMDVLNYVLESQIFDVFVTKVYQIYFGFESRQALFMFPALTTDGIPASFRLHQRTWYKNTRAFHIAQTNSNVYRVISTPYYDAGTNTRVVTISRAMLAPNAADSAKRYLTGKGQFVGVSSLDIKISEFQQLFSGLSFYDSGYLLIVTSEGKLINEPTDFLRQTGLYGTTYEDLDILLLLQKTDWNAIITSKEPQRHMVVTSKFNQQLVVASVLNSENFYSGQTLALLLVIPYSEVYGDIDTQNNSNLLNLIITCGVSLFVFSIATFICMVYVKRKIVEMVSAITELNKCALNLSKQDEVGNQDEGQAGQLKFGHAATIKGARLDLVDLKSANNSKKEVMARLNSIQKNTESDTIKELVKGFENQLKGISKLGKAEFASTNLLRYVQPLLEFVEKHKSHDEHDTSLHIDDYTIDSSKMAVKTLEKIQSKQLKSSEQQFFASSKADSDSNLSLTRKEDDVTSSKIEEALLAKHRMEEI